MSYSIHICIQGKSPSEALSLFDIDYVESKDRYNVTFDAYSIHSMYMSRDTQEMLDEILDLKFETIIIYSFARTQNLNVGQMTTELILTLINDCDNNFAVLSQGEQVIVTRQDNLVKVHEEIESQFGISTNRFKFAFEIVKFPIL